MLLSPVTDFSGEQMHQPPAGDPLLNPLWMEQAISLYAPAGLDRRDPGLSPIYADLAGLPPILVQVGEDELLLNDSLRLAVAARAAGCRCAWSATPACGTCSRPTPACCVPPTRRWPASSPSSTPAAAGA